MSVIRVHKLCMEWKQTLCTEPKSAVFTLKWTIWIAEPLVIEQSSFRPKPSMAFRKRTGKLFLVNCSNVKSKLSLMRCDSFAALVRAWMSFWSVLSYFMDFKVLLPLSSKVASRKTTRVTWFTGMRINVAFQSFLNCCTKVTEITLLEFLIVWVCSCSMMSIKMTT